MKIAFVKRLFMLFLLGTFSYPISAEEFDFRKYVPKTCNEKQLNCGLRFLSTEELQSIPVAEHIASRGLPSSFDLSSQMPPVGDQGQQGSCVAWTTGYGIKSYQERVKRNWGNYDPPWLGGKGDRIFSPAYIYNQINGGRDNGSRIIDAMRLKVNRGAVTWATMPYTDKDFRSQPTQQIHSQASGFRSENVEIIRGSNLTAIKGELTRGTPLAFGIPLRESFMNLGTQVYHNPTGSDHGGHAMVLVGYDDNKTYPGGRGAFKYLNSWSTRWGEGGYGWISYTLWARIAQEVYALRTNPGNNQPVVVNTNTKVRVLPPNTISASRGSFMDRVEIRWSASANAVGYVISRRLKNQSNFDLIGHSTTTVYSDTTAQPMVAYEYGIIAFADEDNFSDLGESPIAEGFRGEEQRRQVPGQVVGLTLQLTSVGNQAHVQMNWTSQSDAESYEVYRAIGRGTGNWRSLGFVRTNSFVDRNPAVGNENLYSVRGRNSSGSGAWSTTLVVNVPSRAVPPSAVTNLRATQGTYRDNIYVTWDPSVGATGYTIYRYDYAKRGWDILGTSRGTNFTDNSLPNLNAWYSYNILPVNSSGNGPFTTSVLGRANPNLSRGGVSPDPPSSVQFQMISPTKGRITWSEVKGVSAYYLFLSKKGGSSEFLESFAPNTRSTEIDLEEGGKPKFYFLRTRSELGAESSDSIRVMAHSIMPAVSSRSTIAQGEGIDRFLGVWIGEYYENFKKPTPVQLAVRSKEGKVGEVEMVLNFGSDRHRIFRGNYASLSSFLESGGLHFELNESLVGIADLRLDSGVVGKNSYNITLAKEVNAP